MTRALVMAAIVLSVWGASIVNPDSAVNGADIGAFFALLGSGNKALWTQHTWDAENP